MNYHFNDEFGVEQVATSPDEVPTLETPFLDNIMEQREEEMERAYHLGLLHGINAASMARVERDVLAFDDYGWNLD